MSDIRERMRKKEREAIITAISKTFGPIDGIPIFSHWRTRKDCSNAGVHRSTEAGICGNSTGGVYSVALSGQYEDDKDQGDVVIYSGAGGKGPSSEPFQRSPQTQDQSWDHPHNKPLLASRDTGNPIRLIRSSNLTSKYAPFDGYRYDGLYKVTSCWTAKGPEGFAVCLCQLRRLPGQPPIPVQTDLAGQSL